MQDRVYRQSPQMWREVGWSSCIIFLKSIRYSLLGFHMEIVAVRSRGADWWWGHKGEESRTFEYEDLLNGILFMVCMWVGWGGYCHLLSTYYMPDGVFSDDNAEFSKTRLWTNLGRKLSRNRQLYHCSMNMSRISGQHDQLCLGVTDDFTEEGHRHEVLSHCRVCDF